MSTRSPLAEPLCGDVWKLADGRHVLIDCALGPYLGLVLSNGTEGGANDTTAMEHWLKNHEAELVVRSEHSGLLEKQHNMHGRRWTRADSVAFLQNVITREGEGS